MALLQDLVSSVKTLRRTPALTLALLLTIALGIGSNATVLGFIRGLVAREPPLAGVESIVSIFARDRDSFEPVSYDEFLQLRQHATLFESIGAARESRSRVTIDDHSAVLSTAAVTPELARLLGLNAEDGIVVSHRIWNDEFGANAVLADARIIVDGAERAVAGVAPDSLDGLYMGRDIDIWVPLRPDDLSQQERSRRTFWTLGRLRGGVSAGSAQTSVNADRPGDRLLAVHPYTGVTPEVIGGVSRLARLLLLDHLDHARRVELQQLRQQEGEHGLAPLRIARSQRALDLAHQHCVVVARRLFDFLLRRGAVLRRLEHIVGGRRRRGLGIRDFLARRLRLRFGGVEPIRRAAAEQRCANDGN